MKKTVALMLGVFSMVACFCSGCNNSKAKENLSISEIEWKVEEKAFEGKNCVVFSYQNNSDFTITGVEIEFKQKDNITEEERSIFNKYSDTQEDLSEFYITANNYYFTKPKEYASVVPCNLVGSWNYCHDIAEYNIMEPTKIAISYIKNDKMFGIEHDYKNGETINLSETGTEVFNWSENSLGNLIPKPNKEVVRKGFDYAGFFSFTIYNASEKDFNDYIEQCKQVGFSKNIDEEDYFDYISYKAEDANGNELHIYYKPNSNHREPCRIEVKIQEK